MAQKKLPAIAALSGACIVLLSTLAFKSGLGYTADEKVYLGKQIFFDEQLSNPIGQSCATCHRPEAAFTDPAHGATSAGVVPGRFGLRNSPSITYSAFAPDFHFDANDSVFVGGLFLDGRANNLADQAGHPLLDKLEMNNAGAAAVVLKLKKAGYYPLFKKIYGEVSDTRKAFANLADAIAAFERSPQVNAFTSKFDYYLQGKATLTSQELRGLQLFNDAGKGNCAACHPSTADEASGKVLFTDFTYDNIGVPQNTASKYYSNKLPGQKTKDSGLGGMLQNPDLNGAFKVPGLRNVAQTWPYFHNGYFNTLEEVVHFYNKRDVEKFPAAEFPATVNHDETGNLGLTPQEEKDIVAFLKTLTDGYRRW